MPQFLTPTLVSITSSLLLQKDYFRNHPIWKPLELELHKRRNHLTNDQLATVIQTLGLTGNATQFFFYELEETIMDSPITIEETNLLKILQGYSLSDQGTSQFYMHLMKELLRRDKFKQLSFL